MVTFDASGSYDPDDEKIDYFWDINGSSDATGSELQHIFNETGTYWVTLTVIDIQGLSTSDSGQHQGQKRKA